MEGGTGLKRHRSLPRQLAHDPRLNSGPHQFGPARVPVVRGMIAVGPDEIRAGRHLALARGVEVHDFRAIPARLKGQDVVEADRERDEVGPELDGPRELPAQYPGSRGAPYPEVHYPRAGIDRAEPLMKLAHVVAG